MSWFIDSIFLLCPHIMGGGKGFFFFFGRGDLFVKGTNLIHEGSILITKSPCKGSYLLILLHWRLAFNTSILERQKHFQSIV